MLFDLLTIILLSAIPAAFSFLLDYALGYPGKDQVNSKAVFFKGWSYRLAKNALVRSGRYQTIMEQLNQNEADSESMTFTIFFEGRKHFKWEFVLGMCSFCTNFYIALIAAVIMAFTVDLPHINNVLLLLIVPVFSHSILRKI